MTKSEQKSFALKAAIEIAKAAAASSVHKGASSTIIEDAYASIVTIISEMDKKGD